ncbi:DASH family cryptochrome [Corallincola spongiicola]|uniref:DASH family cryptochrome n=1 Tax=Corallincola spongiicola TaxID=2520508 RepID=UPI001A92CD9B|nr:DASH family cryptochrome [Corallincola spongiicola]
MLATDSQKYRLGLFWFSNDLRLKDHPLLVRAAQQCQHLLFIFIQSPQQIRGNRFVVSRMSAERRRFQWQTLQSLNTKLKNLDQTLHYAEGEPTAILDGLIEQLQPDAIYRARQVASEEQHPWQQLQSRFPNTTFISAAVQSIYQPDELPMSVEALPDTFSQFRRLIEQAAPSYDDAQVLAAPPSLPPPPTEIDQQGSQPALLPVDKWQARLGYSSTTDASEEPQLTSLPIKGGEDAAADFLRAYFQTSAASHYKETRNALDGEFTSTRFSPWLANGTLSPTQVLAALGKYQRLHGRNESTYWICFELLWREYFQLYAIKHGNKLFQLRGITNKPVTGCLYGERLARWINGTTPYPLVNASMNQLRATGLLSNRGRQIVASCLIHELQLDWRAGAYYFEQQLLDYDVASNWGNWQYIAGVGADPRQGRHFNLKKQQQMFDPEGDYIAKWHGDEGACGAVIDSVDAADWPVSVPVNK